MQNFIFIDVRTKEIFGEFPHPLADSAQTDMRALLPRDYRSKPRSGLTKSWRLLNNKGFKRAFSCGRYHCQSAQAAGPGTHFHVYDWLPRWPRFPCTPNSLAPVLSRRSSVSLTSSAKIDQYCLPARPAARILAQRMAAVSASVFTMAPLETSIK